MHSLKLKKFLVRYGGLAIPFLLFIFGVIYLYKLPVTTTVFADEGAMEADAVPGGSIVLGTLDQVLRGQDQTREETASPTVSEESLAPEETASPQSQPPDPPKPAVKSAIKPKPKKSVQSAPVKKAPAQTSSAKSVQPQACSGAFITQFVCLLNQYRAANGKGQLSYNSSLASVASGHSKWMNDNNIFSHTGINGSRLGERCKTAGISCRAENLAENATSAQNLLDLWKNSPSHNANLLGSYTTVGLGMSGPFVTALWN